MPNLAIIGTGIAGMGAGYFLRDRFDITFYEKNDYPGGHTNTLTIDEDGKPVYIDSGFIVYNEVTYPLLTRLFKELDVKTKPASMSFSVQHVPSGLEYCGTGLNGLFAQRRNALNPRFIRMLLEMDRFNKQAVEVLDNDQYFHYTLGRYMKEKKYGADILNYYLVPMGSAVWSTPADLMLEFPIVSLVRFFKNHGFLGLHTHYQWRTVEGGSRIYREKILGLFKGKVFLNTPAVQVLRENGKVSVLDGNGGKRVFDKVILACHANEATDILQSQSDLEKGLLCQFQYQKNRAILHTDASLMPKRRRAWSSWNYRIQKDAKGAPAATTIYWMNGLQGVSKKKQYFISLNDPGNIDPAKIVWARDYEHPLFNIEAMRLQKELPRLNQNGPIYFCGSYFRYGFHEDALLSSLEAARVISEQRIWP